MGLLDLREYRREPKRYGSLLNYDALDTEIPWLLYQRDNSLLATMALRGPDLESAEDHALVTQVTQLNQIFRRFGSGWCLMSEARHVEVCDYPEASWPEPVSAAVDAERRQFFTQPGQHFITEAYLTLSWRQPQQQQGRWEKRLYANVPEGVDPATWAVESFTDEVQRTRRMLEGPAETVRLLEGAELLTYLHSCATFHTHGVRVPEPAVYLNTYLSQDVDFNAGLYPSLGPVEDPEVWIACVSPQEQHGQPAFPNVTYPGILNVLNTLPFPWRCTQRYLPLNRDEAAKVIRRYAQQHMGARQKGLGNRLNRYKKHADVNLVVDKIAEDRAQEAQDAQAMVEAGHWSQGYLTLTVVLWDKDRAVLARKVQQTEAALRDEQFMAKAETYNTGDAWIGSMPGDHKANVRQPLMTSLNFAHAFPATSSTCGVSWNTHLQGPPLLMARGKTLTPVGISFHDGDVGHVGLIGMTGCHAKGTPILMADGTTKTVENIVVGDELMGPDSLPRSVLQLCRGRDQMVRILPNGTAPFLVNIDHNLALKRTNNGSIHDGAIDIITVREWLQAGKHYQHLHKLYRVGVTFPPQESLPIHPYLLGVLLGDGSIVSGSPRVTTNDGAIRKKIRSLLARTPMKMSELTYNNTGCITFSIVRRVRRRGRGEACESPLIRSLRTLHLWGKRSGDKFIPHAFKVSDASARLWLLAGLIDTDGTRVKKRMKGLYPSWKGRIIAEHSYNITSKSSQLAHDIAFVARSLGFIVRVNTLTKKAQTGNGGTYYSVTLSGDVGTIPCQVHRKQVKLRKPKSVLHVIASPPKIRTQDMQGFSVELLDVDNYYGFELSGDHLYLMEDFTVTHNSGKSVLLNMADLSWLKYPRSEVSIFDKGGAARVLTYLVGGAWYDLGVTPLQPLADIDNPLEVLWAVDWLSGLLEQEHVRVHPKIKAALHQALVELGTWDRAKRTMTHLSELVSNQTAQQALHLYTQAGPYGMVLDADHEEVAGNRWVCFETNSILESPALLASVLPAVFHIREKRLRGAPTLYTMHEGWVALDNDYWAARLRGWLKGFRVRNGSVHLATQSLSDAVTSKIMSALLDNISTWLFSPNDKALEEEVGQYYRACGLNMRQRELIARAVPKRDYYVKAKTYQAMVDLHLGPTALGVCKTYEPEQLDRWEALYTRDPAGFVSAYCHEQGVTL